MSNAEPKRTPHGARQAGASTGKCTRREGPPLPEHLARIITPMDGETWAREWASDAVLIKQGFKVGYNCNKAPLRAHGKNMQSAAEHGDVLEKYLAGEMEAGKVALAGTFQQAKAWGIHCTLFGVIPKKNRPGKFRLILNLSAPEGVSVNSGITKELASLSYVTLDKVAESAARLGCGSLLAKMDINQAYRQVPVHPNGHAMERQSVH